MISLLIIVAIAAALIGPGLGVVAALGPRRVAPSAWLVLPVASIISLALLSLLLIIAFQIRASLLDVAAGLALVTVACLLRMVTRRRTERRERRRRREQPARWRPDGAAIAVATAALLGAVAGWVLQSALYSDTLYHVAQGLKLAKLDPISWSNSAQFVDGSAHPGYVLPTFQALIGLPAMRFDPLLVTLLLPTVIVPLGVLAAAGAGHVIAGTRRAGAVAAWAWLAIPLLGAAPSYRPASLAPYGGEFALHVIAPTVVALVIAAIAQRTRTLLVLIAVATMLVGVLHVSYLVHLAIPMLAIALGWLWTRPREDDTRSIAIVLLVVLAASIAISAALAPKLMELQTFLQDADGVQMPGEGAGKRVNAEEVKKMLVGDDARFHLRSDLMIGGGGTQLIGLLLSILAGLAWWRRPLGWLTLGSSAIVLLFLLWAPAFTHLSAAMGIDQARRLGAALPLVLGVVAAVELAAAWLARWPQLSVIRRRLLAGAIMTASVLIAIAVREVPRRTSRGGDAVIGAWVVNSMALAAVLAVAGLLALMLMRVSRSLRERWRALDPAGAPVDLVPDQPRPHAVTGRMPRLLLALPLAALSVVVLTTAWPSLADRLDAHAKGTSRGEFAWMRPVEKRAIRELRPGSVVLADIHLRTSYRVMALAPVYVVGAPPGHVANTEDNAILKRTEAVEQMLETRDLADAERARLLDAWDVDTVVLRPLGRYRDDVIAMQGGLDGRWRETTRTGELRIYERVRGG